MTLVAAVLAVVLSLFAGILVAASPWVRRQVALSFTRQPEERTELYFSQPAKLPDATPTAASMTVAFTVTNFTGRLMTYPYTAILELDGARQVVGQGSLQIADGRSAQRSVDLMAPSTGGGYVFTVMLPDQSESIRFKGTIVSQPQTTP